MHLAYSHYSTLTGDQVTGSSPSCATTQLNRGGGVAGENRVLGSIASPGKAGLPATITEPCARLRLRC
jgi:hypothetical protein